MNFPLNRPEELRQNVSTSPILLKLLEESRKNYIHWHDHAEILLILEGFQRIEISGRLYEFKEGDFMWLSPRVIHSINPDESRPSKFYSMLYDETYVFGQSRSVATGRAEAEHGTPSAHYNAYYDAILLLGYRVFGKPLYLEKGRAGLETLMELYPETRREQSETQEMCRLVLPLALLYEITGEEKHREMLYRVTADLQKLRHPFGGYMEWDTGYKAACSRDSRGECSLLTENGDPVADQLYSSNWLPMGFGYAYHVTGDPMFKVLWRDIVIYFLRTQLHCTDARYDGAWSRAFDMNRREIYACPHDAGWAAACLYAGWSAANILAGMMLPDYLALKTDKEV